MISDYEKIGDRLAELREHFNQCELGAFHDMMDSVSESTRHNYEGQSDAFKSAGESLDKAVADLSWMYSL